MGNILIKNPTVISGGGEAKLYSLSDTIYDNNSTITYNPSSYGDYDGFSSVSITTNITVETPQPNLGEKLLYPPINGAYYSYQDNLEGYNKITVGNGFNLISTGLYGLPYYDGTMNQTMLAKVYSSSSGTSFNLSTGVKYILPGACSNLSYINFEYTNIDGISTIIMPGAFSQTSFSNLNLAGNYITAQNNAFVYCTFNNLYLGGSTYGINHLTSGMFMSCYFSKSASDTISFGTAIQQIDDYAFQNLSECPRDLYFDGTIDEWGYINKGTNWNASTGGTVFDTIHCSDGNINL